MRSPRHEHQGALPLEQELDDSLEFHLLEVAAVEPPPRAGVGLGPPLEANLNVGAITGYLLFVLLNVLAGVALGALLQSSATARNSPSIDARRKAGVGQPHARRVLAPPGHRVRRSLPN